MVSSSVKVYVTCVVVLYIKFLIATFIQATKTFQAGFRSPEDNGHVLAKDRQQNYGLFSNDAEDDEATRNAKMLEVRWKRLVLNDLEALPLGLIVFGAGLFVDTHEGVHIAAMIVFTVARICHTIAYGMWLQPHRAYCWRTGVLAILTGGVAAVVAAYK
jgi:glutathione S-transferase